jgi:hypothetical protein
VDKDIVEQPADFRVWKAPELTVLGKLRTVTESGSTQFGDAVPNQGTLPGDSGNTS